MNIEADSARTAQLFKLRDQMVCIGAMTHSAEHADDRSSGWYSSIH